MAFSGRRQFDQHTEQIHVSGGERLRDLVLGLNDGLVASFAVTSGLAGAAASGLLVVMAGLAEMLGGAISMGLASFISVRSHVEFYQSEIERERVEMEKWPEREREEIRHIYRAKGFSGPLLEQVVEHITADPERWRNVMMREELGLTGEFDSPLHSGLTVGAAYLLGATVPVLPYLFVRPAIGILVSAALAVFALFTIGALKATITTRSWWRSGLESALTGAIAAAATFAAGRLFSYLT